jgi:hypothetical protein
MEIVYLPGKKIVHETEKAVLVEFKVYTPFSIAHRMQRAEKLENKERKARKIKRIEKMMEETCQMWIPKSIVKKDEGEFMLVEWRKEGFGNVVHVICEGHIDDLIASKREHEIEYELALKHAVEIVQNKDIKVNIKEEEWRVLI